MFLIGLTQDPKTVAVAVPLLIFPQMFLSGALIPVAASSGLLGVLAKIIPMTYSIDLARNIFYWGKPEYAAAVLHPPWLDLAITVGFFLVFTIVGTSCSSGPTATADSTSGLILGNPLALHGDLHSERDLMAAPQRKGWPWTSESSSCERSEAIMTPSRCWPARSSRGWMRLPD